MAGLLSGPLVAGPLRLSQPLLRSLRGAALDVAGVSRPRQAAAGTQAALPTPRPAARRGVRTSHAAVAARQSVRAPL